MESEIFLWNVEELTFFIRWLLLIILLSDSLWIWVNQKFDGFAVYIDFGLDKREGIKRIIYL